MHDIGHLNKTLTKLTNNSQTAMQRLMKLEKGNIRQQQGASGSPVVTPVGKWKQSFDYRRMNSARDDILAHQKLSKVCGSSLIPRFILLEKYFAQNKIKRKFHTFRATFYSKNIVIRHIVLIFFLHSDWFRFLISPMR